jgi:Ni/Co efflux regulator RcnB
MKKLITVLISCSLALAASAIAQQDQEQQKPKKEKAPPPKSQPANQARSAPQPRTAPRERATTNAPGQERGVPKARTNEPVSKPHAAKMPPGREPGNANAGRDQIEQRKKEHGAPNEPATANKPASSGPAAAGTSGHSPAPAAMDANKPNPQANKPAAMDANKPNPQANKLNAKAKKPDPQTVQKIKTEHANFRAQPKPDKVPPVTFEQGHRISGSERWQGSQYEVFRSYHPERHDQSWYRSHFNRIELIGGGYYYWNNGYWFPAWGYDSSAEYYAYDAPIYVGHSAEPPDRVIADVQATLQQMGYYQGEVDGLLGPLTRQALAAYQADNGLTTTEVIDEPTLQSLGMA